ncbi:MAG: hydrogenase nickel incorporation protein HypB [Ardenticatenaceae bacterium]|nr:hydrogenase nickel incorporation protein HypB [Ardenticatenaceae bacterium]
MTQLLKIQQGVLSKNDLLAQGLRGRFREAGVFVTNWVSSPGSGKTALLETTMRQLTDRGHKVAALVGDLATENDAQRLKRSGAEVRQIVTAGTCHLEADMIERHLEGWEVDQFDFLFIENVGNLVCPSSYDLGEDLRIVLLSVTEGEDKPLKYPPMFHSADLAVITKIDLAEAVEFDRSAAYENIKAVGPQLRILETSAKRGTGLDDWIDYLLQAKAGTV